MLITQYQERGFLLAHLEYLFMHLGKSEMQDELYSFKHTAATEIEQLSHFTCL